MTEVVGRMTNSIEQSANFEGNDSLLLFQRLHNPAIRTQIINLIHRFNQDKQIESIEWTYDSNLDEIENETQIHYDGRISSTTSMAVGNCLPWSGEKATQKQTSITEAHEKGHIMRPYKGTLFRNYFSSGFNPYVIAWPDAYLMNWKTRRDTLGAKVEADTPEEIKAKLEEYLFSGREIAERMSQLKNYFGMSADEQFTKEHLAVVKARYISDTGYDNHMSYFLQAITPDTEEEFLRLMNTSGI
jgi:hypothetical protein